MWSCSSGKPSTPVISPASQLLSSALLCCRSQGCWTWWSLAQQPRRPWPALGTSSSSQSECVCPKPCAGSAGWALREKPCAKMLSPQLPWLLLLLTPTCGFTQGPSERGYCMAQPLPPGRAQRTYRGTEETLLTQGLHCSSAAVLCSAAGKAGQKGSDESCQGAVVPQVTPVSSSHIQVWTGDRPWHTAQGLPQQAPQWMQAKESCAFATSQAGQEG